MGRTSHSVRFVVSDQQMVAIIGIITRAVQIHEVLLVPHQKDISFHLPFLGTWSFLLFPPFFGGTRGYV